MKLSTHQKSLLTLVGLMLFIFLMGTFPTLLVVFVFILCVVLLYALIYMIFEVEEKEKERKK